MRKREFVKSIIGILLMIMAIGGLVFWESYGRTEWTMTEVLVAAVDIEEGTEITEELFKTTNVPKENIISAAIKTKLPSWAIGRTAGQFIPKNSQISSSFFEKKSCQISEGSTLFLIKPNWISSMSSTLRAADTVQLYSENGDVYLGTFEIAFVKGDGNQEIVDAENPNEKKRLLERSNGTGVITHFEIIANLEDYEKILDFVNTTGRQLLVIQEQRGGR